ncbi:MAG: serine/threonine protein kinase [Polyangiaceae bacterium]|nr:serine/threonine protein kinase [Polyangiaceae bacterium]
MMQVSDPAGRQHAVSGAAADGLPERFGRYALLRRLATGGMAELFLALHRSVAGFEKLIVIKRILPSMNDDKAFIDMLLHEARIAATLSHPNVVEVYDVGFEQGAYYIAMEHIQGEDLRCVVRQMKKLHLDEFPMEHALTICMGVCAGLAYAHEKRALDGTPLRIVHRDISPQNVVVAYTGEVKVVDFGIAKSTAQVGEDTKSGRLKGKVPYMSPEQAMGEQIDWRSDIFSAGIILFELTTGKRLFKGANELETLRLICERDYPYPSQVRPGYPRRLETIVMRALAKNRAQRYQSAREMQADLEAFVRDERAKASGLEVGSWMQALFADKIDQQKGVLQDLKLLADVIVTQTLSETLGHEGQESATSPTGQLSASGSAHTLAGSTPSPRRSKVLWLGVAAAMLAVAGGSYLIVHNVDASTTPARSTLASGASAPLQEPAPVYGSVTLVTRPPKASTCQHRSATAGHSHFREADDGRICAGAARGHADRCAAGSADRLDACARDRHARGRNERVAGEAVRRRQGAARAAH